MVSMHLILIWNCV